MPDREDAQKQLVHPGIKSRATLKSRAQKKKGVALSGARADDVIAWSTSHGASTTQAEASSAFTWLCWILLLMVVAPFFALVDVEIVDHASLRPPSSASGTAARAAGAPKIATASVAYTPALRRPASAVAPRVAPASTAASPAAPESWVMGVATGTSLVDDGGRVKGGVLIFLRSLFAVSPRTRVILFVSTVPPALATAEFAQNVIFEIVANEPPLGEPWSTFHPSNSRHGYYKRYLAKHAKELPSVIILSDVRDVYFQSDPFVVARAEMGVVHVFDEKQGITIGAESWNAGWVRDCYGAEGLSFIAQTQVTCSGFVVGDANAIVRYVNAMASELVAHAACERNGVDQGLHNVLVAERERMGAESGEPSLGHRVRLASIKLPQNEWAALRFTRHPMARGSVWTGGFAQKGTYDFDNDGRLRNGASASGGGATATYAVLHQYDRHTALVQLACDRYRCKEVGAGASAEVQRVSTTGGCMKKARVDLNADVMGDVDHSHVAAESMEACCKACTAAKMSGCSLFVFSASNRHCWLKMSGGRMTPTSSDTQVGRFI